MEVNFNALTSNIIVIEVIVDVILAAVDAAEKPAILDIAKATVNVPEADLGRHGRPKSHGRYKSGDK